MTEQATPRPWEQVDNEIQASDGAVIARVLNADYFPCADDPEAIAKIDAECEANAALIVAAVNAYEPMKEALRKIAERAPLLTEDAYLMRQVARAALALTEVKP